MSISYKVTKCKTPNGIEGTNYYAARAQKNGEYDFKQLTEDINNSTTVTAADAYAVLKSMKSFIQKALLAGQVVVLDDLCRIQVGITGKCYSQDTMAASDFSPSAMIKGVHINFRPDKELLRAIRGQHSLRRISSEAMA